MGLDLLTLGSVVKGSAARANTSSAIFLVFQKLLVIKRPFLGLILGQSDMKVMMSSLQLIMKL